MAPEEGDSGDGKVLSPQELDLADKDGVEEIEEGRFVVSPDGSQPKVPDAVSEDDSTDDAADDSASDDSESTEEEESDDPSPSVPDTDEIQAEHDPEITRADVREWTADQLESTACDYGYHLSLKAGEEVRHHTLHSDDVAMVFNNLLLWYAQTVDSEMPPGAVLGILLTEASTQVRYPVKSFEQFLLSKGVSPDDSVGELLAAVREDDQIVFPPRDV